MGIEKMSLLLWVIPGMLDHGSLRRCHYYHGLFQHVRPWVLRSCHYYHGLLSAC